MNQEKIIIGQYPEEGKVFDLLSKHKLNQLEIISGKFAQDGEDPKSMLRRLVIDEARSINEISIASSVDDKAIAQIVDTLEIPRPRKGSSESEAIRARNVRLFWQDPKKRREASARIHTPEAIALMTKTKKEFFRDNTQARAELGKRSREVSQRKRRERVKELFGTDDLKEVLESLNASGLDRKRVADKLRVNSSSAQQWANDVGVELKKSVQKRRAEFQKKDKYRQELVLWAKSEGVFNLLTDRQRQILDALYGGGEALKLKEVALKINSSRQIVSLVARTGVFYLEKLKLREKLKEIFPKAVKRQGNNGINAKFELNLEEHGLDTKRTLAVVYRNLKMKDLTELLGCSEGTARRLLKEAGVKSKQKRSS